MERDRVNRPQLPSEITEGRVVAIARRLDPGDLDDLVAGLRSGGLEVLELTLDGEGALEAIRGLQDGGLLVGAGTVMSVGAAASAVEAGARFVVSPHTDERILEWGRSGGIPVIPGAFTPTEVVRAWQAGASAVKLFPASVGGVALLRELRGPLRDVPFIPTGGLDAATASAFLAAGAAAVGIGSWLTAAGTRDAVAARARQLAEACSGAAQA
jgi:2-dehydro-3-deoxyphosphogluconate aldolase/(4S)-4-hydroxy-2-oxoglutarate aldolase